VVRGRPVASWGTWRHAPFFGEGCPQCPSPTPRSAKPPEKTQRIFDGGGLHLEVAPAGGKWWRLKYRFGGKEKRISFGVYPETGLKGARAKREEARKFLADGIDPGEIRKATKATTNGEGSFEAVAREWWERFRPGWTEGHAEKVMVRFDDACKAAIQLGFVHEDGAGSQRVFKRRGEVVQLNFQDREGYITAYQARQLVHMIEKYGEANELSD
jgi:hypothetical protein